MKIRTKLINSTLIILTFLGIILRFLLNEKGRVNPDSIRYMRQASLFPVIDNTTAPLGYPLVIKFFTFFGSDEFWSSKIIGLLAYSFILIFAYRKQFFFRELLVTSALFSFVSIFSYTMSEALVLPFIVLLFYISDLIIAAKISWQKGFILLAACLIILLNIRYNSLFLCVGSLLFGIINYRKNYAKSFWLAGLAGLCFYGLYKVFFIDYFNKNYVEDFLQIGLKSTPALLFELFQGLGTSFNPFIHIANPGGGIINIGIYGIGILTILVMIFLFIKTNLTEIEKLILCLSVTSIVCSFFIQYFYSVNALDYRLLAPFSIGIWMVFFRKLFLVIGSVTYTIALLSLLTGFVFTWLSKGDYLENRRTMTKFLKEENLQHQTLKFYMENEGVLSDIQIAELISTINPRIYVTMKASDTLQQKVLTRYRVEQKISIKKNKYQ